MATQAAHSEDAEKHVVELKELHVILQRDGKHWFAQSLEIDYASAGSSFEEVKTNFERGLCLTVKEHIRMTGGIKGLLKAGPQEAFDAYYSASTKDVKATVNMVQVLGKEDLSTFPFEALSFIQPPEASSSSRVQ